MSSEKSNQPKLPTSAIDNLSNKEFENWFEYPIKVHPHHTDYSGVVWHGSYIEWMEEARVECLHSIGVEYSDLVALGCDLQVVDLSIRYHSSLDLGQTALVKTRMSEATGVRINWDYAIVSTDEQELYATAQVGLVALDRERGNVMPQLPPDVKNALTRITSVSK